MNKVGTGHDRRCALDHEMFYVTHERL